MHYQMPSQPYGYDHCQYFDLGTFPVNRSTYFDQYEDHDGPYPLWTYYSAYSQPYGYDQYQHNLTPLRQYQLPGYNQYLSIYIYICIYITP